ncbi:MAG: nucleotidyltransferase family protein [Thermosynechococcaceae cyanobacterium]
MTILNQKVQQEIVARILQDRAQRSQFLTQMKQRQEQGWQVARQAAQVLKTEFGVQRTVLFGSMLDVEALTWHSDIDLAVWGLAPCDLFKAGARIEQEHDFDIDLVPVELAKPHIITAIRQGIEL